MVSVEDVIFCNCIKRSREEFRLSTKIPPLDVDLPVPLAVHTWRSWWWWWWRWWWWCDTTQMMVVAVLIMWHYTTWLCTPQLELAFLELRLEVSLPRSWNQTLHCCSLSSSLGFFRLLIEKWKYLLTCPSSSARFTFDTAFSQSPCNFAILLIRRTRQQQEQEQQQQQQQ